MKTINIFNNTLNTKHTDVRSKILNEIKNRYGFKLHTEEAEPKFHKCMFCPQALRSWLMPTPIERNLDYAKRIVLDSQLSEELKLKAAINRLRAFAKKFEDEEPDYDYVFMGLPVKFYDKFVQIGSHVIPLYEYRPYFEQMSEEKKENIINLIFNISDIDIEIAA